MWLIYWRQRMLTVILTLIILITALPSQHSQLVSKELLEGWWQQEQAQSHCTYQLVRYRLKIGERELRMLELSQSLSLAWWATLTISCVATGIVSGGSNLIWSLLLLASHKLAADLRDIRSSWITVVTEQADRVLEMQNTIALARTLEDQIASEKILDSPTDSSAKKSVIPSKVTKDKAAEEMVTQLSKLVVDLPIGTNLGMLHFLWMLVTGQLLASRGAIFPALQATGLSKEAVRRAWAAFSARSWQTSTLLSKWHKQVITQEQWKEHEIEGYRPLAVDLTAFWRPTLQNCATKHYKAEAGRALPAIVLGVATHIGDVGDRRIPLPAFFVRSDEQDPSEEVLKKKVVEQVKEYLDPDQIPLFDAGFQPSLLHEAGLKCYVVRLPINFVGRRNYLPEAKKKGKKREYGQKVRPLARRSRTRLIPATAPDRTETLQEGEHTIQVQIWQDLVLRKDKPGAQTLNVYAFHDPRYKKPLLLGSPQNLTPAAIRALYRDRWPVEQLPLAAKQMIGAHRQFVFSDENCQRLPEISLLAGSILTYVAATLPPIPTGFWDRAPKATPGRLRRFINNISLASILANFPLPARIRQKESVTDHLLKGVLGHKRHKRPKTTIP